jgi:hypothetical protein
MKFVVFDAAGALIWSSAYVGAGWAFRTQLEEIVDVLTRLGSDFVVSLVLGFALYIAAKYVRRWRLFRELQIARNTPIEIKQLIDEGRAPRIVDLRLDFEKAGRPDTGRGRPRVRGLIARGSQGG